jgi:hypothetical protein
MSNICLIYCFQSRKNAMPKNCRQLSNDTNTKSLRLIEELIIGKCGPVVQDAFLKFHGNLKGLKDMCHRNDYIRSIVPVIRVILFLIFITGFADFSKVKSLAEFVSSIPVINHLIFFVLFCCSYLGVRSRPCMI